MAEILDVCKSDFFFLQCIYCKDNPEALRRKDRFALDKVSTLAQMQIGFFKRHCSSMHHIEACKRRGIIMPQSEDVVKASILWNTPPASMFLWSLTTCFTASTHQDYKKFLSTQQVCRMMNDNCNSQDGVVGAYSHNKTCAQIVHCFGSIILEANQDFVRNSVHLAMTSLMIRNPPSHRRPASVCPAPPPGRRLITSHRRLITSPPLPGRSRMIG